MTELLESLHIEWPLLIAQIVNFLILLAILGRFVYKPLMGILSQRREMIAQSVEKSQQLDAQFKEAQEHRAKELTKARREAQSIIVQAKNIAESERQKIQEQVEKKKCARISSAK
jgi:F-type H+-transporting ATPase subunit b